MFLATQAKIQQAVREFAHERYNLEPNVIVNQPPRPAMGDMALPLAMELGRRVGKPPRQVAEELAAELRNIAGVAKVEVAGPGYVNVYLNRADYAAGLSVQREQATAESASKPSGKIIVEHTNINPNKAAHIGHLRNAALGDTLVRLLRSRGNSVEVQNYIDNTGVQVADVVVGFLYLEKKSAADVAALISNPSVRFDYYCWDLYASVSHFYEEDSTRVELRGRTLQEIEHGGNEASRVAETVAMAIVRYHLATMFRLNVEYDLLPRESEILHLKFWDQAFQLLRERGAIYFETEGKNKGCWVMRQEEGNREVETGITTETEPQAGAEDTKVIVRSNGTVTYVGKDIAYQLWKFGLLGKDFWYRPFQSYPDGRVLWVSATEPDSSTPPTFGRGEKVYNVIDVRQSYLQNIVAAGLRALGYEEQAVRSIHFSYEMVALSPRCCADMGIELSPEDRKRPYVEVSGRRGLGVKADDLVDRLIQEALREVQARHTEESPEFRQRIARQIAIGALRYFLLKYTCNAVIAFDFKEALNFEGETGPYVQYAVVRARNIFRKLEAEGGRFDAALVTPAVLDRFLAAPDGDPYWELLFLASKLEAVTEQAIITTEPAAVAKYAFQLAQSFNNFYHRFRILTEQDESRKAFLLWLVEIVDRQLTATLDLLGIEVPEAM
ncbi:MAG: arginine--tRNA ligase [Acidobacteria bacterium]|nr:arginine--tRNA ligase [Acidobacteriota bacterium]